MKIENVYIPINYLDYCNSDIITMEYINGTDLIKINKHNKEFDLKLVQKTLAKVFNQMIFQDGFIHCDPHSGNILLRK